VVLRDVLDVDAVEVVLGLLADLEVIVVDNLNVVEVPENRNLNYLTSFIKISFT
jgi:hypothetical protein